MSKAMCWVAAADDGSRLARVRSHEDMAKGVGFVVLPGPGAPAAVRCLPGRQGSAVKNVRKRVDCDGTSSPMTTARRVASLDA
jgi:hypothetical protein